MLVPVLIAIIAACALIVFLMVIRGGKKKSDGVNDKIQRKGKNAIMKEIEKKLAHDPHNVESLETLGDIYFSDKNWEKTYSIYKTLYDISSAHIEINVAKVTQRMGIAVFNLEKYDDAINFLLLSVKKEPEVFDTNYFLGKAFYIKEIYDKALYCLKKARMLKQDSIEVVELVGMCFFKLSKYRDSLPFLKKVYETQPDNKEILYDMAVAMGECDMQEKALKVFTHLRPDPQFGPQSCLECGKMHEKVKNYQAAVQDYEIALKLQNVPEQLLLQIKYRLASVYIAMNDIPKGLAVLKQIQAAKQNYKDVESLVTRYSELNQNKNLQTYLLSGTSDFIALCRRYVQSYFPNCFVKVDDVQVLSECVELLSTVQSNKGEEKDLFRFYRSQAVIGDIYVREFHTKVRDTKCDFGICITMGSFTESAHKFTEGRSIDLIEKEQLLKTLKKVNMLN